MVAAAAATSILSLCGSSPALADSDASGTTKDSPGVLSGNNVQVPVDAPVNACGNSVDAVALLNPAFGNSCANDSGSPRGGSYGEPYGGGDSGHGSEHGTSGSGSSTHGHTAGSPGVGSGNNAGVPVDVPVNACGNTADVISGLNPAFGNDCDSGGYGDEHTAPPYGGEDTPTPTPPHGGGHPTPTPSPPATPTPPNGGDHPWTPTPTPPTHGEQPTPPGPHGPPPQLADTGSSSEALLAASGASAPLIAAGSVLYRRGRAASRR